MIVESGTAAVSKHLLQHKVHCPHFQCFSLLNCLCTAGKTANEWMMVNELSLFAGSPYLSGRWLGWLKKIRKKILNITKLVYTDIRNDQKENRRRCKKPSEYILTEVLRLVFNCLMQSKENEHPSRWSMTELWILFFLFCMLYCIHYLNKYLVFISEKECIYDSNISNYWKYIPNSKQYLWTIFWSILTS